MFVLTLYCWVEATLTSGIMLCTREMSLFSRRFMYLTMLVSE